MADLLRLVIRAAAYLTLLFFITPATHLLAQGKTESQNTRRSVRIRWDAEPGITRYRLQLARDEEFKDIVFDLPVIGQEYALPTLPAGRYYWRVAPAAMQVGTFTPPAAVDVDSKPKVNTGLNNRMILPPSRKSGWQTATGNIMQPIVAPLRTSSSYDLVGVNSDGIVYALDGASGAALWTARYKLNAKRNEAKDNINAASMFTPVVLSSDRGVANVVVAFDGGVRALKGATGREIWRVNLPARALSGVALNSPGNAGQLVVVTDSSPALSIMNAESGQLLSQAKLDAPVVGAPGPFTIQEKRGVVISLEGGVIEMRDSRGERVRSVKLDTSLTTAPIVVQAQRETLVLAGTESGLLVLDATDLRPLRRIAMEGDAPRGMLTAADLDGDGVIEVVMVTRRGRTVVVNPAIGKIKWYAEGAVDAASASFIDLNGDGALDVLVAAGSTFAIGLSGRDGALIWKAEGADAVVPSTGNAPPAIRALATAPVGSGASKLVIGSDQSRTGLRAVLVSKSGVKAATP